jgi:hypothetical protein
VGRRGGGHRERRSPGRLGDDLSGLIRRPLEPRGHAGIDRRPSLSARVLGWRRSQFGHGVRRNRRRMVGGGKAEGRRSQKIRFGQWSGLGGERAA